MRNDDGPHAGRGQNRTPRHVGGTLLRRGRADGVLNFSAFLVADARMASRCLVDEHEPEDRPHQTDAA